MAALNLDMVGRLRDEHLMVFGSRSGYGWRRLLSGQNDDSGLRLEFSWSLKPNADHYPFFEHGIPVLMLHTGLHDQYHRPSDVAKLINTQGMTRVTRLLFGLLYEMADRPAAAPASARPPATKRPETEAGDSRPNRQAGRPAGRRLDRGRGRWRAGCGCRASHAGSPAEQAGLRAGDRIVRFAGRDIHSDDDFFAAVAAAESPASLTVQRPGEKTAAGIESRRSAATRCDGASCGEWTMPSRATVILTHVVPGSPAARAGLAAGDRIYQVAGRDFADEAAFARLAKTLPMPLQLLVERDGRLRIVVLRVRAGRAGQAAA